MTNKHDQKVRRVAGGYKSQGYNVRADSTGYKKPLNVAGRRADVVAIKGRDRVLVEVETRKSMVTDTKQRQNLRSIAKRNGYQFRTVKTR
jgi:hypothetical protein